REMMHAADAPGAATRFRRVANVDDAGGAAESETGPAVLGRQLFEAEDRRQKSLRRRRVAFPELGAVETANLPFRADGTALPRGERPRLGALHQRHLQAVRIREGEHALSKSCSYRPALYSVFLQAQPPEVEASRRNLETDFHGQTVAWT